jgi:hypothetical protein
VFCSRLALAAVTPQERTSFSDLAEIWLRLAVEAEQTLALHEESAESDGEKSSE